MTIELKQKLAFALLMGIVTTGIVSFTLVSVNLGLTSLFLTIWLRSWLVAYITVIPIVLFVAPRIQAFVYRVIK
jgi:hypothetical protein